MIEATTDRTIGLVGLGLLGSAITRRLIAAGWHVVGFDTNAERSAEARAIGVELASDVSDLPRSCRRIVLSLPTSEIATSVVDTLLSSLRPGDTIIDTTTGSPEDMIRLGDRLAASRVDYLDATVAGSSSQVSLGESLVLVGGDAKTLEDARDVFTTFAAQVIHLGPCGAGAKAKLVHNLVLGLNRAVMAEALALARALGLDLETMLTMLRSSPAVSRVVEIKGPRMIHGRFEPEARLAQHLKDVRLILEAAEMNGCRVPLSKVHAQLLAEAVEAGWGELDNSAIFRVFEAAEKDASRDKR